jgi:hypothetical protein
MMEQDMEDQEEMSGSAGEDLLETGAGQGGGTVGEAQHQLKQMHNLYFCRQDVSTQAQADQEDAATAAAANTGVIRSLTNAVTQSLQNAIANARANPVATAIGIAMGPVAGLAARGIDLQQ